MLLASFGLTADPALMAIGQAAGSGPGTRRAHARGVGIIEHNEKEGHGT
jgi:hypothetical protein